MKGEKKIEHAGCVIKVASMQTSGGVRYNSMVQYLGPSSAMTIGTLWSTGDDTYAIAMERAKRLAGKLAALCAQEIST